MNLYILIGLPGSGKSTWTDKKVRENDNICVINKDMIRNMVRSSYNHYQFSDLWEDIITEIASRCLNIVANRELDIIIDETNITKKHRKYWIDLINRTGKKYNIIYVHFTESVNNLTNRMKSPKNVKEEKWREVIEMMKEKFEPIDKNENYNDLILI